MTRALFLFALAAFTSAPLVMPAAAAHDPNVTATLYVLGYDPAGAGRQGVFGDDHHEPLADSIAAFAGLPTSDVPSGPLLPNAVVGTNYYGDTPPSYYSPADVAEVAEVTSHWGGGVPRYALIVAKHARRTLARSGAQQVNFVSASFGSLIVRWLIEHDVEGLASEGRIARWLTVEGLVAGNWAASHDDLVSLLELLGPAPIDVNHMTYDWIETHLHTPRTEAADPAYAGILIGQVGSTDDRYNNAALRGAMLAYNEYQPNDGVQGLHDARFHTVTAGARFAGMPPTLALFHATHPGLASWRIAWAEAATFLTARRRVTVTMTSAQVTNLREPQQPFWDWRPAEVVFEGRVHSPAAEARWAVTQPLSAYVKEGAAAPLRRYRNQGETQQVDHVVFDDLVRPDETELRLDLHAYEVDYDLRYGVVETLQAPYFDDLGGGTLVVSALAPGTYTLAASDWSCQVSVSVFEYPFASLVAVPDPSPAHRGRGLAISPNPFGATVRIVAPVAQPGQPGETATLEIADLTGRIVRRIESPLASGFTWDGRGTDGRPLPAGVYLHRVSARQRVWHGRSCLVR
jgi:flagellar hook capping protein FlgD